MGQKKGNPIPSYQNQGYEQLYPNKDRSHERTNMVSNVQLDIDTNIEQYISDRLKANLPITSSGIIVNGSVRAEEYIVNIFSSSILYSSGSTIFGDSLDDIHEITGSFNVTGSTNFLGVHNLIGTNTIVGNTLMTGTNTIVGNTEMSGSIDVSGSSNFHNSLFIVTGSAFFTGSHNIKGNSVITGSLDVKGNINVASGSDFYLAGNKLFNYGQFYDTTTQSGSANTAYPMKLNTTDISSGVSVVNGTQIKVDNTGIYNLQFSTQFQETVNAAAEISVWLRKGGVNVANSNTEITIEKVAGGGKMVAAWNYIIQLNATEYVELMWSSDKSTTQLHYHAAQTTPTRPVTPSLIATLTQIA